MVCMPLAHIKESGQVLLAREERRRGLKIRQPALSSTFWKDKIRVCLVRMGLNIPDENTHTKCYESRVFRKWNNMHCNWNVAYTKETVRKTRLEREVNMRFSKRIYIF